MADAYTAAIFSLRRAAYALRTAPSEAERERLHAQLVASLDLIALVTDLRRPTTRALAVRVAELERQLADRAPGERARIICERLDLSRSRYYRLRQSHLNGTGA